jgi:hypothetical protein
MGKRSPDFGRPGHIAGSEKPAPTVTVPADFAEYFPDAGRIGRGVGA